MSVHQARDKEEKLVKGLAPSVLSSPAIYALKWSGDPDFFVAWVNIFPSFLQFVKTKEKSVIEKLRVFRLFCSGMKEVFFECGRARIICILFQCSFYLEKPHLLGFI